MVPLLWFLSERDALLALGAARQGCASSFKAHVHPVRLHWPLLLHAWVWCFDGRGASPDRGGAAAAKCSVRVRQASPLAWYVDACWAILQLPSLWVGACLSERVCCSVMALEHSCQLGVRSLLVRSHVCLESKAVEASTPTATCLLCE